MYPLSTKFLLGSRTHLKKLMGSAEPIGPMPATSLNPIYSYGHPKMAAYYISPIERGILTGDKIS